MREAPGLRARVLLGVTLAGLMAALAPAPARADAEADKAAITARLQAWTDAFNARESARTCDLFSKDLVSTMRGRADEGHDAVCRRIAAALADHTTKLTYAPDIEEIIVSGDLAVVRLVWSVTLQRGPKPAVSKEPGSTSSAARPTVSGGSSASSPSRTRRTEARVGACRRRFNHSFGARAAAEGLRSGKSVSRETVTADFYQGILSA